MEAPRRNTDTRAATYKRKLTKWRRWALEMQENGWNGGQPIPEPVTREDNR